MQVDHVVIDYRDRPEGSVSKLNTFSDGLKVLSRILSLYKNYKPLAFFSLLSGILAVLAVVFLIPILVEYWQTGLVPRFPTLIVCGFVLIAALQSLFAGLVLQSMEQKNKQDFEMRLIQAKESFERKRLEEAGEEAVGLRVAPCVEGQVGQVVVGLRVAAPFRAPRLAEVAAEVLFGFPRAACLVVRLAAPVEGLRLCLRVDADADRFLQQGQRLGALLADGRYAHPGGDYLVCPQQAAVPLARGAQAAEGFFGREVVQVQLRQVARGAAAVGRLRVFLQK